MCSKIALAVNVYQKPRRSLEHVVLFLIMLCLAHNFFMKQNISVLSNTKSVKTTGLENNLTNCAQ